MEKDLVVFGCSTKMRPQQHDIGTLKKAERANGAGGTPRPHFLLKSDKRTLFPQEYFKRQTDRR